MNYNKAGEPCGIITNIQKYTIHDGPGIRTEIFFKGCPLRCLWCSNPETINPKQELGVYPDKCLGGEKCATCIKFCPLESKTPIDLSKGHLTRIDMLDECSDCLVCADVCPSRAIKLWGEKMTVDELLKIILQDRNFYIKSGGGVTLSGGEVMLQWDFAALLLEACKKSYIHTCVESALFCPQDHMEEVYKHTDFVITDIKHMDSDKHKEYTGVGNELILRNIIRTVEMNKPLVIRIPVIPDHNNSEENIRETGRFIRDELGNRILQLQLLPYKKMGTEKYESLNRTYPMGDFIPPERPVWEQNILELNEILLEYGVPSVPGSSTKISPK
jgi:pyruvate formate lyase activating enzyme